MFPLFLIRTTYNATWNKKTKHIEVYTILIIRNFTHIVNSLSELNIVTNELNQKQFHAFI